MLVKSSLKILNEDVHWLTLRITQDRLRRWIDSSCGVLSSFNIVLKCVGMIFLSGSSLQTLCSSMLSYKFLNSVRNPDVNDTDATDSTKPGERCLYISGSIVPVQAKQTTNKDAPSNCFDSVLESKQVLNFESTVFYVLVLLRVFEEIGIWGLVLLDVLTPKLMDLWHFVRIFLRTLVEGVKLRRSSLGVANCKVAQIHVFIHAVGLTRCSCSLLGSLLSGIWNFGHI